MRNKELEDRQMIQTYVSMETKIKMLKKAANHKSMADYIRTLIIKDTKS